MSHKEDLVSSHLESNRHRRRMRRRILLCSIPAMEFFYANAPEPMKVCVGGDFPESSARSRRVCTSSSPKSVRPQTEMVPLRHQTRPSADGHRVSRRHRHEEEKSAPWRRAAGGRLLRRSSCSRALRPTASHRQSPRQSPPITANHRQSPPITANHHRPYEAVCSALELLAVALGQWLRALAYGRR